MSMHTHHGRVIPLCRACEQEADVVIAHESGDANPYCFPCGNTELECSAARDGALAREYPIEEFYTPSSKRVSQFDPDADPTFDLFDPDAAQSAWMSADNSSAYSSIRLENAR